MTEDNNKGDCDLEGGGKTMFVNRKNLRESDGADMSGKPCDFADRWGWTCATTNTGSVAFASSSGLQGLLAFAGSECGACVGEGAAEGGLVARLTGASSRTFCGIFSSQPWSPVV